MGERFLDVEDLEERGGAEGEVQPAVTGCETQQAVAEPILEQPRAHEVAYGAAVAGVAFTTGG